MASVEQGEGNPLETSNNTECFSSELTLNLASQRCKISSDRSNLIIHKLPAEIIAYMFEIYVSHDGVTSSRGRAKAGAFTLGAVCRLWRHVAWKAPRLWSTLWFLSFDARKSKFELAVDWIRRSGRVPLTIYIIHHCGRLGDESLIFPLIDIINQSLSRCRVLYLSGLTSAMYSRFSFLERPALLEYLSLSLSSAQIVTPLLLGAHAAPTGLDIDGIPLNILDLNWSNLTEFKARGLYFNEILDVLFLTPQLLECRQDNVKGSSSISPGAQKHLTLLSLKSLEFSLAGTMDDGGSLSTLLQQATFPNLKECTLGSRHIFPTESFISFVSRSSCTIKSLGIMQAIITVDGLINIAQAMPSIKSLSVSHWTNTQPSLNGFFTALCQNPVDTESDSTRSNGRLLPLLWALTVSSPSFSRWELIIELCNQRCYDGTRALTRNKSLAYTHRPVQLGFVAISRMVYVSDYVTVDHRLDGSNKGPKYLPSGLIDDWGLFLELLELKKDANLILTVQNADNSPADLFDLSYRKLIQTQGQPPEHMSNNKLFKAWISNIDLPKDDSSSDSSNDSSSDSSNDSSSDSSDDSDDEEETSEDDEDGYGNDNEKEDDDDDNDEDDDDHSEDDDDDDEDDEESYSTS